MGLCTGSLLLLLTANNVRTRRIQPKAMSEENVIFRFIAHMDLPLCVDLPAAVGPRKFSSPTSCRR